MKDCVNNEVNVGDTVQFWDGVKRPIKNNMIKGHVRGLCKDDHVIVDLFQRLDNGQTRLTMPSSDILVIKPVVA